MDLKCYCEECIEERRAEENEARLTLIAETVYRDRARNSWQRPYMQEREYLIGKLERALGI